MLAVEGWRRRKRESCREQQQHAQDGRHYRSQGMSVLSRWTLSPDLKARANGCTSLETEATIVLCTMVHSIWTRD